MQKVVRRYLTALEAGDANKAAALFVPNGWVQSPFLGRLPVRDFFAKVAGLPRIINIADVSMGDAKTVPGQGPLLTTSCLVKTYMFVQKPGGQKTGEKDKKVDAKK